MRLLTIFLLLFLLSCSGEVYEPISDHYIDELGRPTWVTDSDLNFTYGEMSDTVDSWTATIVLYVEKSAVDSAVYSCEFKSQYNGDVHTGCVHAILCPTEKMKYTVSMDGLVKKYQHKLDFATSQAKIAKLILSYN